MIFIHPTTARPANRGRSRFRSDAPAPRPTALAVALRLMMVGAAIGAVAQPRLAHAQAEASALPAGEAVKTFDVPAGPLDAALDRFARIAGVNLAYDAALIAGLTTNGVSGSHGVASALSRLLAGTGLEAVARAGGGYSLRRAAQASPAPVPAPDAQGEPTLPAVRVTASAVPPASDLPDPYAGGQVARGSRIGMLGNRDVMDTPFQVTSYTSELIRDQQAVTVADVLANDPSVRTISYGLTNAAGAGDSFLIRGFSIQNSMLFDGLYGIAPSRTLPVETAERIEVLKGANALLNGMAPYDAAGGAINMVPKRAPEAPLTRLTATYLSKGVLGGHLDVARRFGDDHQWGIRFNGVYRNGDTATSRQSVELGAATIAIDYRGTRLRASVDAGHQTMNNEAPQGAGGLGIADDVPIPRAPSARRQAAQAWERARSRSDYLLAKLDYDIAPDWTIYGAVGGSDNRFRYLSTDVYVIDAQGDAVATAYYWPDFWNYRTAQGGVRGAFVTGGIRHRINLNVSWLKQTHGYTADYYGFTSFDTNIYDPTFVASPSLAGFSSDPPRTDSLQLSSFAVSDTISFLDDRAAITVGARHQRVKSVTYGDGSGADAPTYDRSALTPMLAVLFKPRPRLSVYGNYIEGLGKGDSAPIGTTNAGQMFPPIKTRQYEAGIKYDFGRVGITAGVFQIEKPSGLPVANADGTFTYRVSGEQRNRGVEANVFGELARGVRLLGGIAGTDARLTHTDAGANDGNVAPNVPRWQANLLGEYDAAAVPGLTLWARVLATRWQYVDATNERRIPGWARWDVGARYQTRAGGRPLVLRAGVENLFGRDYWSGGSGTWLNLGRPRTITLSATVDF